MNKLRIVHEASKTLKKYVPECISISSIYGVIASTMVNNKTTPKVYLALYKATGEDRFLVKYYQMTKSNNWLKMHDYPMRRKSR